MTLETTECGSYWDSWVVSLSNRGFTRLLLVLTPYGTRAWQAKRAEAAGNLNSEPHRAAGCTSREARHFVGQLLSEPGRRVVAAVRRSDSGGGSCAVGDCAREGRLLNSSLRQLGAAREAMEVSTPGGTEASLRKEENEYEVLRRSSKGG